MALLVAASTATVAVRASDSSLLSTIAGNAATLVGIVGGFTVARVVALAGEREGLQRQLDEAQGDLREAERRLDERDADLLAEELHRAVWDACDLIVDSSGQADGNELLQSLDRAEYDATPAQLVARLDEAAAAFRACLRMLGERAKAGVRYREWKDARPVLAEVAPGEDPDLLERFWDEFEARETERKRQEAEQRRRAEERASQRAKGEIPSIVGSGISEALADALRVSRPRMYTQLSGPMVRPILPRIASVPARMPARAQLVREVEDARADVAQLHAAVARTSVPADLRWGLTVLALFALVSIVLPVVLMALDVRVTPWWRGIVTCLFVAGIVALVGYIALTLRTASGLSFWPRSRR